MNNLNEDAVLQEGIVALQSLINEYKEKSENLSSEIASFKSSYKFVMRGQKQVLDMIINETSVKMNRPYNPNSSDLDEMKFSLLIEAIEELIILSKNMNKYVRKAALDLTVYHKSILSICKVSDSLQGSSLTDKMIDRLREKIEDLADVEDLLETR